MLKVGSIVIRCRAFERMLAFWSQALRYGPREPATPGWVVLSDPDGRGPSISLDQVPPERELPRRGRLHLDLYAEDQAQEVERLLALGATRYAWRYPPGADYVVLADPDGNLFCVVQT